MVGDQSPMALLYNSAGPKRYGSTILLFPKHIIPQMNRAYLFLLLGGPPPPVLGVAVVRVGEAVVGRRSCLRLAAEGILIPRGNKKPMFIVMGSSWAREHSARPDKFRPQAISSS